MPIHDEIILSFPRNLLPQRRSILKGISEKMTDMPEITVPLEVEWKKTTTTWDKAKELTYA
jgi:DNA polymerase I-like protein with 3'-5' exonuclease and polymerase domains